jgi:O-antigen chain-terminating methyltransferase
MAESGAIQDQTGSAGDDTDERDLVQRQIGAAMTAPPPPPMPGPQAASPVLAQGLERMRGRSDLFGFTIAPRRPVAGMRNLKRLLRRLQAQTFVHQSEFNQAATAVAQMLASEEHGARRAVHAQAAALTSAEARIAGLESRLLEVQAENRLLRERFEHERVAAAVGAAGESDAELDYLGLQARFRGDEDEIAERQRLYVERFDGLSDVLDIGCGRGEFLALLRDAGIPATGVDTDADMVKLCQATGLDVVHGDGLTHLEGLEDESLGGVFAAQVIEHLEPARIVSLVRTARTKLRPGGALIIETVNPASVVALSNFYLDFTHVKPVHPLALQWLAESLEFADSKLVYLSPVEAGPRLRPLPDGVGSEEEAGEFNDAVAATNEVLYGPRDYVLIARRP